MLLNLSGVRYQSSSELATLAWLHLKIGVARGSIRLYGLEPSLYDALKNGRLDRVFEVDADEGAALDRPWPEIETIMCRRATR